MPRGSIMTRSSLLKALVIATLMLAGCSASKEARVPSLGAAEGQISIFLQGLEEASYDITFTLGRISVESAKGKWHSLPLVRKTLNSKALLKAQALVAEGSLPKGRYGRIRLYFTSAYLRRNAERASLALPTGGLILTKPFDIFPRENTSLFLYWNADRSVAQGYRFSPLFSVERKQREPRTLLVYVSNTGSDNVSVFNRVTDEMLTNIQVGREPRGIVVSPSGDRVYVVNRGSSDLSVIDTSNNRVLRTARLEFQSQPEGLAITPDGSSLLVTYAAKNAVAFVDTFSLEVSSPIQVGSMPVDVAIDSDGRHAFVVNRLSNNVSVIDIGERQVIKTIDVESNPRMIALDSRRQRAYVAHYNSVHATVISLTSLSVVKRLNVGAGATAIAVGPLGRRIYVAIEGARRVNIINPEINVSVGSIPTESLPSDLAVDPEGLKVYIVNSASDNLTVANSTSRRVERLVGVGSMPYRLDMRR